MCLSLSKGLLRFSQDTSRPSDISTVFFFRPTIFQVSQNPVRNIKEFCAPLRSFQTHESLFPEPKHFARRRDRSRHSILLEAGAIKSNAYKDEPGSLRRNLDEPGSLKQEFGYFAEPKSRQESSTICSARQPSFSDLVAISKTQYMPQLLADTSKISFEALKAMALSNVPKTERDARDVGWELSLFDKIQEYAVILARFKIGPFQNLVA